jgi:hypothetical protein
MGLLGLISQPCFPQATGWDTLKIWHQPSDFIASDPLGQFYRVRGNLLIKHNADGDSLFSWSSPASGRISRIDASDPLRILVFHPDFNVVRFLDNRLAPLAEPVRLDDLGVVNPLAICTARQGSFWVVDGSTLRLTYFGKSLDPVIESAPVNRPDCTNEIPAELTESGDKLYLNFPGCEIQVYDLFGNYVRKIPLKALSVYVINNFIMYVLDNSLFLRTDPMNPDVRVWSAGMDRLIQACPRKNRLMARFPDRVLLLREEK